MRNLNSLKKRDVKVEIERNETWEYREIKEKQSQKTNKKAKKIVFKKPKKIWRQNNNRDKIKNRLEIKRG